MSERKEQKVDPYMNDCYAFIHDVLGSGAWIPVYFHQSIPETKDEFFLFSALAPQESQDKILSLYDWEVHVDSFHPGFSIQYDHGTVIAEYSRFSREDDIEPIIIQRHFYGVKETFFDISEEFRHLYNLYYDEPEKKYMAILDDGNEEDVIRISDESILINAKYLKEFLAIKKCVLVLYFNIDRYSQGQFSEIRKEPIEEIRKNHDVICSISICNCDWHQDGSKIYSRLLGKKIIDGLKEFDPENLSGSVKRDEYLDFIIGVNSNGDNVTFSCNENELANFFGKNPGKPNYVTPVFFDRKVLEKYYADMDKYTVHDGYLSCGGLWSLRLDNNHDKYVIVMLGDLGGLSISEQQYWKSFNVKPEGGFSDVAFKRGFAAEFTDPSMEDLKFKGKFELFQETWIKKNGWPFFLPLEERDSHYLKKIRVPLKESQSEFDELVLAITKVLIDSLNEKKIQELLSSKIPDEKGIAKLQRVFSEKGITGFEDQIQFLRDLQNLKSATASHRKGDEYNKIASKWGVGKKRYREVYCYILDRATRFLEFLEGISLQ
jgi:hypothetical protein